MKVDYLFLCESGFNSDLDLTLETDYLRKDGYLFGEAQSRVVVSVKASKFESFEKAIKGIPYEKIGMVTGGRNKGRWR